MSVSPDGQPRRCARLLALGAALAVLTLTLAPAGAQLPEERPISSVALRVTDLEAVVTPDEPLSVSVRIANSSRHDREDLRLLATVHRDPIGRFRYQQALDEGEVGQVIHGFAVDVDAIPARGARTLQLTQTAEEMGLARPAGQEGVYPLRLQLLSAGEVVDEATTALVLSATEVELPLRVALVLPLLAPPSRDGQGMFTDTRLADAVAPAGDLGRLAAVLEDRPDLPLTLAVDALTLEEVSDLSSGFLLAGAGEQTARSPDSAEAEHASDFLARVRGIAQRPLTHLLAQPYASADLVALERQGMEREVGRHIADGAHAIEAITGDRPLETMLWPPAGIDRATVTRARSLGIRTLVLSETYLRLPGPRGDQSPSPVRQLRAGPGTTMPVLVPDPWLEQTLVDDTLPPPLLAQRIIGEIATLYHERPGTERRGVLLAVPPGGQVDADLIAHLADGLADASFVEPVTLTTLARRVEPDDQLTNLDYPTDDRLAELPASYLQELTRARRALGSLDGVLVEDRATPARFDRSLLQAASVAYRDDLDAGRSLLSTITDTVDDLYAAVTIPESPAVTLTSVEGQLPVTVRSSADVPMRVLLHVRTASYEIEGGPTRELVLEPDSAEILTFSVRALRPGRTDGVQLVVTDADGVVELASGTVVVRSTAFSVAGLVVTAGAALFLAGWAARELARRRSADRPQPASSRGTPRGRMPVRSGDRHGG